MVGLNNDIIVPEVINMVKLRCFIAMAFEKKDADEIYSKDIKPLLIKKNIKPIRIIDIKHNDWINVRIFSELKKCDFVIADLTYARPSVYFEAGFAEPSKPVVYTCRKDHFAPKNRMEDEFDNFKVHFDLQMKKIIPWSKLSDRKFLKLLNEQINLVTKPLLVNIIDKKKQEKQIKKFTSLSIQEQIKYISDTTYSCFRQLDYNDIEVSDWLKRYSYELGDNFWLGKRYARGKVKNIIFKVSYNLTKNEIFSIVQFASRQFHPSLWATEKTKQISNYIILSTIQDIPPQRIKEGAREFKSIKADVYESKGYESKIMHGGKKFIPRKTYLYILDNIKSKNTLINKLSNTGLFSNKTIKSLMSKPTYHEI